MKGLLGALQFMTILPLGKPLSMDPRGITPFFPVVGLVLGLFTALSDLIAVRLWSPQVAAIIDVVLLIVLTGALHLDGLGDTADGIFSHRGREKALEIMKDSRIGAMGLVTIVAVLGIKTAGIAALHENRLLMLMVIPAFSRTGILFAMHQLPYGRPDGGLGGPFFRERLVLKTLWGALPATLLALLAGLRGMGLCLGFALITAMLIGYYRRQMNCVTGDMLGAMIEVSEALLFLMVAMGGGR